ncbi:MAG: TVP38/TMEM64 family protein [Deltaproteobacteria bacterium]|nr:TVP38/TMEM64 family protein [Deltaproteobacteria bacterium]
MSRRGWIRLGLGTALALGIALVLTGRGQFSQEAFQAWVDAAGVWAPLAYLGVYLIAPSLMLPGAPLTLAGGALFGPWLGGLYALLGATGGATLAFLLSRYLAGDWAEQRASGFIGQVREGVAQEGWRFVAFTRLVPLFPFNVLNYALGLTRLSLRTYVLTSLLGMAPGSFGYAWLGQAGKEVVLGEGNFVRQGLVTMAVVAALVLVPWMAQRWRRRNRDRAGRA